MAAFVEHIKQNDGQYPTAKSKSKLFSWVKTNRWKRSSGALSDDHVYRVEAIGFVWQVHKTAWELRSDEWKKVNDADKVAQKTKQLAGWGKRQRKFQKWASGNKAAGKSRKRKDFDLAGEQTR